MRSAAVSECYAVPSADTIANYDVVLPVITKKEGSRVRSDFIVSGQLCHDINVLSTAVSQEIGD